jgi:uncharacterized protein (TIGR02996 family)
MTEKALLAAIHADPSDTLAYRALADWLEEHGQGDRAELLRLDLALREMPWDAPTRPAAEERLRGLLADGVRPCVPTLSNGIGMEFALIPAGRFLMGSPPDEEEREEWEGLEIEGPRHQVEIMRPFYLGVHPVTVGQFRAFAEGSGYRTGEEDHWRNPVWEQGEDYPVTCVSWDDAAALCEWLTKRFPEHLYRLPTEAEWEYACRAGTTTAFHYGDALSSREANFCGNYPYGKGAKGPDLRKPAKVGSYKPNAWGLYDMHGNVSQWCSDWFDEGYYAHSPAQDPPGPPVGRIPVFGRAGSGPEVGPERVFRGGDFLDVGRDCRAAHRRRGTAGVRSYGLGVRLALALPCRGMGEAIRHGRMGTRRAAQAD